MATYCRNPNLTSIQLRSTLSLVGFDTILTLHNSTCGTSPSKLWHLPKTINLDLRDNKEMYINPIIDNYCRQLSLGVTSKKNSIFKDIVHIGGGEVNPFSKELKKCFFEKSWRGRGSQNKLSKIEAFYCQAQLQLSAQLKAELALFPLDPATHQGFI